MRSVWAFVGLAAFLGACAASSSDDGGGADASDASNGDHDSGSHDAGGKDATVDATVDASIDASSDSSLDAPNDGSIDASLDADAGSPVDAAPDVVVPTIGITWPAGQVFPTFAPIAPLDVVLSSGRPNDMLTLVTTMEGIVNKTKPRIFISDEGQATKLWLSEMQAVTTTVPDPLTLVTKYKSEIAGIVIYDDTLADTLNLATTIAGIKGGIVASPALATTLMAAPYNMPVIDDLRTLHFTSKLDVYQYEFDHCASATTHRLIIGLTPGIPDHLRDYAVATNAMTVWLDPTVSAEATMLGKFLALLPPNSPYMGWWTDEPSGVHLASTYGVPVYAADWSLNLTVLGGTPRGSTPPQSPPPPKLEKKLYIAMFMSDGDNLQEDEGLIPLKWADSNRGAAPINWTIDPALVDVGPVMLRYFQRTATVNDYLVSGPSGLGYTYPQGWPSAMFDQYTKVSGAYLDAAGLRVTTLWNNGADLSTANAQSYVNNAPNLLGVTIQDSTTARQFVNGKLPIERMTLSYGDTAAIVETGVDNALKTYDGSKPQFAAVQGNMNMGTMQPTAFADVQSHYESNTNVVFVRADHFFQLMSLVNGPPAHKSFSGDWNGDGKTDTAFYYGGNGDWWFGISDGQKLTWNNAGNVAGFGNLLDIQHEIYTGDFTGDGKTDFAFFSAGDNNWWLGTSNGTAITWAKASTSTFGNALDGKHTVRIGDYDGDGKSDVCVHSSADGSWWLGISSGTAFTWKAAGATGGFGNLLDGSHALYDGDFDGDGKADVLFYYNGDHSFWFGKSNGSTLTWSTWGNTNGFGNLIDNGHRIIVSDFTGDHKADILFYYSGDGHWFLGTSSGTGVTWAQVAATAGAGNFRDWNHRLFAADVDGDGKNDVISLDSATGTWTVGHSDGTSLTWTAAATTSTHGDLADLSHLLAIGDYDGDGKKEPLFYGSSDGNWWLGHSDGTSFSWVQGGNTSGFGDLTR